MKTHQEATAYQEQMTSAINDHIKTHGHAPKIIMLGDAIWRDRADHIAEGMNRTGPDSKVVVYRLPAGVEGVVCA